MKKIVIEHEEEGSGKSLFGLKGSLLMFAISAIMIVAAPMEFFLFKEMFKQTLIASSGDSMNMIFAWLLIIVFTVMVLLLSYMLSGFLFIGPMMAGARHWENIIFLKKDDEKLKSELIERGGVVKENVSFWDYWRWTLKGYLLPIKPLIDLCCKK